ncbi:hypothetical protein AAHE18_01G121200 [Arachis hypogaea]
MERNLSEFASRNLRFANDVKFSTVTYPTHINDFNGYVHPTYPAGKYIPAAAACSVSEKEWPHPCQGKLDQIKVAFPRKQHFCMRMDGVNCKSCTESINPMLHQKIHDN